MSQSPTWVCTYQEQCDCILHTRHLRSGREEGGKGTMGPALGKKGSRPWRLMGGLATPLTVGTIPDEETPGGRKGWSELVVGGYRAARWEAMVAEVCLVTRHQQSGSRVAKTGLQLVLSFLFSLAQPTGQCYPRLWTVFPPQ